MVRSRLVGSRLVGSRLVGSRFVGSRVGSRLVGLIVGLTLVPHISHIARVGISNIVGDNLGAAIRKVDTVLAIGSIVITVLIGSKVGTRVVISNSILILVDSRSVISRLMVGSWLVRSRMRGRLVGSRVRSRLVGSRMGNRLEGSRLVGSRLVDRGWVVDGSRLVGWSRSIHRSWSMVNRGVVSRGMDRTVGGSMSSSRVLLLIMILVDLIRGSSWLAHHSSMIGTMRLVHRGAHSRGVAMLDTLVAALVGSSEGEDREKGNKDLRRIICYNTVSGPSV